MSENITRLVIVIQWNGGDKPYYRQGERLAVLERWIEQALDDRDDNPEIVSFGEITR